MSNFTSNGQLKSLPLKHRGKVGDLYSIGDGNLLLVRSDRVSGFNVKLSTPILNKGVVLNRLSEWWMSTILKDIVPNHLTGIPLSNRLPQEDLDQVSGRAVIVKTLTPIPIEAVVRRHITGSGYKDYTKTGEICGIKLSLGLKDGDRLSEPIFTPTEKSDTDPAITFDKMCTLIDQDLAERIREVSMKIFSVAEAYLLKRGIILADTKFEFGLDENGVLTLMDEVLTPDSSRFWLKAPYERSGKVISLDKQKVRDWMKEKKENGTWDGVSSLSLPPALVSTVSNDYWNIFGRITQDVAVGVVMGSNYDWSTMKATTEILERFCIPFEARVVSAHRTPHLLYEYGQNAKARGLKAIIAGAGGAAHLPGMLAAVTTVPICGVPVQSKALSGLDSLYSIVQMPKGIPVATFAIGEAGAANAALFVVAMLATKDQYLADELEEFRKEQASKVMDMVLPPKG